MKKLITIAVFSFIVLFMNSCTKGLFSGNVTFWYSSIGTDATVNINGKTGYITGYYGSQPNCNATYCANFNLPVGTYNYSASSSFSTWSGTVSVTANGCRTVLLQ